MDSASLAAFKAVYECGSLAKAAEKLYISPQGLGKTISRLESELGCTLFHRTAHGADPTEAADAMYPRVAEAINVLDGLRDSAVRAGARELRVAVSSGYIKRLGPDFTSTFETGTGWKLSMEEFLDEDVLDEVESGRADCGFSPAPILRDSLDAACVVRHPYQLLVRQDDPLASRAPLDYADLVGRDLVALGNGHAPYKTIAARFAEAGARPASFTPIIEITTGINLARRGEAGCFITDFAASSFAQDLQALSFTDPGLTWDLRFVTRHGATAHPQADALRRHAETWIASHRGRLFE